MWHHFDELEDSLILDELIMLNDAIIKREKENIKVQAIMHDKQPVDEEDDEDIPEQFGSLDPRILEHEREHKRKKEEAGHNEFEGFGLGYVQE